MRIGLTRINLIASVFACSIFLSISLKDIVAQHYGVPIFQENKKGEWVSLYYSGPYQPVLNAKGDDFSWQKHSGTLVSVELSHMKVPTRLVSLISTFKELRNLKFGDSIGPGETEVEVGAYKHLGKLSKLQTLELVRFKDGGQVSRSDYKFLSKLAGLKRLTIFDELTSDDLKAVLANKNLEYLHVDGLVAPDSKLMEKLGALENLSELHLGFHSYLKSSSVTPLINALEKNDGIKAITFAVRNNLNEREVKKICGMLTLTHLELGGISIKELPLFSRLQQLEVLRVRLAPGEQLLDLDLTKSNPKLRLFEVISDQGSKVINRTGTKTGAGTGKTKVSRTETETDTVKTEVKTP